MKVSYTFFLAAFLVSGMAGITIGLATSNSNWGIAAVLVLFTLVLAIYGAAHLINDKG